MQQKKADKIKRRTRKNWYKASDYAKDHYYDP